MSRLRRSLMARPQIQPVTIPAFWPPSEAVIPDIPQTSWNPQVRPGILTLVQVRPGILTNPQVRPGILPEATS